MQKQKSSPYNPGAFAKISKKFKNNIITLESSLYADPMLFHLKFDLLSTSKRWKNHYKSHERKSLIRKNTVALCE